MMLIISINQDTTVHYSISGPQGKQNTFSYVIVSQETLYQDKIMSKSLFSMLYYIENNLTILTLFQDLKIVFKIFFLN
jgi:hypothetical protein